MDEMRNKEGNKASAIAIIANCILTVLNITVGLMSGSYALVSEGAHTLSDVATSVIAFIGFKIGQKPADSDHPIGHGRAEAISGLVIVLFLAMVAYEIITGAIHKIMNPATITVPGTLAALMAVFGIFINLSISEYIIRIGKKIKSPAIVADGKHQRTDVFSSIAILVGVIVSNIGFPILDPIIGLVIGVIIIITAFRIGRENIDNIMGKSPSDELEKKIKRVVNKTPHAQSAHNIRVDYYGAYATAYLHIELDGKMTLEESHSIVHEVEDNILKNIPEVQYVMIHACPIGINYDHEQKIDK